MQPLVEEAIQALTKLDAGRLDQLLAELKLRQLHPPSSAEMQATLPGQRVLAALLRHTERNVRLLQRSSPCNVAQTATGVDVYPAAWRSEL